MAPKGKGVPECLEQRFKATPDEEGVRRPFQCGLAVLLLHCAPGEVTYLAEHRGEVEQPGADFDSRGEKQRPPGLLMLHREGRVDQRALLVGQSKQCGCTISECTAA